MCNKSGATLSKPAYEFSHKVNLPKEGLQFFPTCWWKQFENCLNSIWINGYVSLKYDMPY